MAQYHRIKSYFMGKLTLWVVLLASLVGLVFLFSNGNTFSFELDLANQDVAETQEEVEEEDNPYGDIGPQEALENPPEVVKAIYATSWSASSESKMNYLIDLVNTTELNSIVIDIKDFSGMVLYDADVPQVDEYGAKDVRIGRINSLIKRLHDSGIYVIARQTIFQDPALAKARPDLAVKNINTGEPWEDRKGISWIDPSSREAWDYNLAIAKDAASRGFDEINFDYIRFPSDGNLSVMSFPFFDEVNTLKTTAIREFFEYVDDNFNEAKTSADIFGLTTVNYDGLGIGQVIEDAYRNFDYVAPMVYPSHYASGFQGYTHPASHPYEVVNHSMQVAVDRFNILQNATGTPPLGKLRPWLQDFDLGATYTADMVRAQIQATYDADPTLGWMLWDPSNNYTPSALLGE